MERTCICQCGTAYGLDTGSVNTIDKLNTVTDTINEMSKNYKEAGKSLSDESDPKLAFLENLRDRLDTIKENILYEDLLDEDGLSSDIYEVLLEKDITKEDIVELLEKRNEYILGFDDFDTNMKIEDDLNKAAGFINDIYRIGKVNNLWKQKLKENKKVMSSQLDGVSRAISNVAELINKNKNSYEDEKKEIKILCSQKNIELLDINIEQCKNKKFIVQVYIPVCKDEEECRTYELENIISKVLKDKIVLEKDNCALRLEQNVCKQVYMSKDRFTIQVGIAEQKKESSLASGDSNLQTKLDDGKYVVAISDGMGSGVEAKKSSQMAVKMLERLLSTGFDKDTSLELINSSMYINSKEDSYATLDVAILDLYAGNMEFMKNGACPTFIKNNKSVDVVKSVSLPARNTRSGRFGGV